MTTGCPLLKSGIKTAQFSLTSRPSRQVQIAGEQPVFQSRRGRALHNDIFLKLHLCLWRWCRWCLSRHHLARLFVVALVLKSPLATLGHVRMVRKVSDDSDNGYLDFKHNTCPLLASGSPPYFQCLRRWSTIGHGSSSCGVPGPLPALKETSPGAQDAGAQ